LAAFVVGAVSSGRIVIHIGPRRGRMLAAATAFEVTLVIGALVAGWVATDPGSGVIRYLLIVLLGLAAGIQNGTARKLAVPDLTTTVLTMTISGTASESRAAGGPGSRVGRRGLSPLAMFSGALVGAAIVVHGNKPLGLLIAVVLLVVVAVTAGSLSRAQPVWDRPD
jgi:MFS family permease